MYFTRLCFREVSQLCLKMKHLGEEVAHYSATTVVSAYEDMRLLNYN